MKKHYTTLYAQLCMQAQHKYFSGKTLSGRGRAQSCHCIWFVLQVTAI